MSFKVVDDTGKVLTTGRELTVLQHKLAQQAAGTFAQIYQREFNRDGLTAWDFGDLPENLTIQRFGMTITAFPALVDQGEPGGTGGGCGLRLFPSQKAANAAHRAGICRLFRLEYRKEVKYVAAHLPHLEPMALHYHSLGKSEELKEQLLALIVDRALFADAALMRTQATYEAQKRIAAIRLLDIADSVCELVAKILAEHHAIRLLLEEAPPTAAWRAAMADVHDQLVYLLPASPPGFLLRTPWEWLEHYPYFLAGIRVRLEKLRAAGPGIARRDADYATQIAPLWRNYVQRREEHAKLGIDDPQLELYRWMLEAYRVALFAQELGQIFQVSHRRLEKQWEKVRK
jgi:ATP-dependent helicase HrpA